MACLERCDDKHVGHFFFNYVQNRPDEIFQIDAATGEQETRRSVLSRTIRLAQCFRNMGLQPGDVLVLGGRNHLDMLIPFYAALLNGLPMAGVDPQFKYNDIKLLFKNVEPKIAFCESTMYEEYQRAVQDLGLDTKIVTFGGGECTMKKFMEMYGDNQPEKEFNCHVRYRKGLLLAFEHEWNNWLPESRRALRHSHILHNIGFYSFDDISNAGERRTGLNMSSIQWISACYNVLLIPINYIMVLTSAPASTGHVIDIMNKYKPAITLTTPSTLAPILHHEKHCDLTCFDVIKIGGSKLHNEFLSALKARLHKNAKLVQGYGQTENGGAVLDPVPDGPFGNLGKPMPSYQVKCYYNNPKATAEAFSEDGFYKTGDLVYRDENDYYFFVERLKMLLKYRNYQVVPPEVEEVVLMHEGVADVCVTGVPHPGDGERVVACVVRKPGSKVTAQEIKDLVASQMSVPKHLHGGVVFMEALPLTTTGKVARAKVKEAVLTLPRE